MLVNTHILVPYLMSGFKIKEKKKRECVSRTRKLVRKEKKASTGELVTNWSFKTHRKYSRGFVCLVSKTAK
jgi:hypothetical protein